MTNFSMVQIVNRHDLHQTAPGNFGGPQQQQKILFKPVFETRIRPPINVPKGLHISNIMKYCDKKHF